MKKTYEEFLHDLGISESSGRYDIINKYGYAGKYQMGEEAMVAAGYYKPKKVIITNGMENLQVKMEYILSKISYIINKHKIMPYVNFNVRIGKSIKIVKMMFTLVRSQKINKLLLLVCLRVLI